MRLSWVVGAGLLGSCVRADVQECGDGIICPTGMQCWEERNVCIDPQGLSVPDTTFDFGRVACGTADSIDVELSNFGATDTEFTASTTLSGIRVIPEQGIVPAGETLALRLEALPVVEALPGLTVEGTLEIDTYVGHISRPLTLTVAGGIATVTPELDFGEAAVSTTTSRMFEVTNMGDAPFDVLFNVAGAGFSLNASGSRQIQAQSTDMVEVSFAPNTIRTWSGTLALTYLQPLCQPPTSTVSLEGVATGAPLLVSMSNIKFATAACSAMPESQIIELTSKLPQPQTLSFAITGPDASAFSVAGSPSLASDSTTSIAVTRLATPVVAAIGRKQATLEITSAPSGEKKIIPLVFDLSAPLLRTPKNDFVVETGVTGLTGSFDLENRGSAVAFVSATPGAISLNDFTLTLQPNPFQLSSAMGQKMQYTIVTGSSPKGTRLTGAITLDATGSCSGPLRLNFDVTNN